MRRLDLVIIGTVSILLAGGCGDDDGGSGDSGTGTPDSMADGMAGSCVQEVFDQSCAMSGCHDPVTMATNLDLSNAGDGSQYVGQAAATMGGACAGMGVLIDSANPDMSLFITKLEDAPSCGNRMPLIGSGLSNADRTCIEDWARAAAGM
ncbi:MAG: hypothetical protein AAGF12_14765 [Myxococcota bacterium]